MGFFFIRHVSNGNRSFICIAARRNKSARKNGRIAATV
ncbi:Hypothetical protein ETEE_3833 [Edwardsiella anguillarum ET080813]|uniref:Uncharacterized protein n=1 Tax=Edwardsiella anguillarum ET080813 TaxID=667120 RepID=A0A076LUV6_9GAMM|nr:Hypothetical protein ETEE_3833 [Edwardsiella anguillarum ET080813]